MESKLKTFVKAHLWLIILIGVIGVGLTVFWTAGYFMDRHEENKTNSAIQTTQTAASTAVNAAVTSEQTAAGASNTRQTEDAIRSRTIAPQLDQARRQADASRSALTAARQQFNEKVTPSNSNRADDCVRLARLYPDTRFEYCQ
jgi:hypothetical protein